MNARVRVPQPVNEPVLEYRPGSAERKNLKSRVAQLKADKIDIPLYIGGKEVRLPERDYDPRQVTDFALSNWTELYTRARVAELRGQQQRLAAE